MQYRYIKPYILSGNCTFTLMSTKIDKRYTYKIQQDQKMGMRYFCKVMYGPDNVDDYRFLGWFYLDNFLLLFSGKSCYPKESNQAKMLSMFLELIGNNKELPETCLFYPSAYCGRCGRLLTTPDSITRGIGPECIKQINGGIE